MNTPNGLDMVSWWSKAACKGMNIDLLKTEHCYQCSVQQECLWSAVSVDDRTDDNPLFIRGGLRSTSRSIQWGKHRPNVLKTYVGCMVEMLDRKERSRIKVRKSQQVDKSIR